MGFMVGKSSDKPSLKLHLLWLGMPKLFIYCNYSIIFNDLLYW
jgi:hypothetical protein